MSTPELNDFLVRSGLADTSKPTQWTPLTGGVSSDIWRVDFEDGHSICVKRALAQLKVAAEWKAPVSRNAFEWKWIQFASQVVPNAVPQPLAHDEAAGLFAMGYLDPGAHPVWKLQLFNGVISAETAAAVGRIVGTLHQASSNRADIQAAFDTTDSFHALRLDPYLLATARRHPHLAKKLEEMVQRTATHRSALVHGDVSPKNILIGPNGPVLLDAECAWYGDPAFDIAFCLNHLLLKRVPRADKAAELHASFNAFVEAYFGAVSFDPRADLEARAAALLPALMLARVDGKSPVEYITQESDRECVRAFSIPLIINPPTSLQAVAATWFT